MALNVISNFAANVAHRNLTMSDAAATSSLTKLSSGSRVVSAKDDAASLAIGSRLRAEVAAMKTASVNAGQAGSMLQIADGAMATISDILVRMKELAVQASSGQFSSVERGVLDSEFQALSSEITRISDDTEFNGTQLIAGAGNTVTQQEGTTGGLAAIGFAITYDTNVSTSGDAYRLSYDYSAGTSQQLSLTNVNTGDRITVDIEAAIDAVLAARATPGTPSTGNLLAGETVDVAFTSLGITVTLDDTFDRTADLITEGALAFDGSSSLTITTADVTFNNSGLTNTGLTELLALGAFDAATGLLTLNVASGGADLATFAATAGLEFDLNGGGYGTTTGDFDTTTVSTVDVRLATSTEVLGTMTFTDVERTGATDTLVIDVGNLLFGQSTTVGGSNSSFTFKVGTGNQTYDSLTFSVNAASASALGVLGTAQAGLIGITTANLAETASTAVSAAIDTLNQSRSDVGAAQNRLTFASNNLASAIENAEAARSNLLDLDVASEITVFTSKQILIQTGVSMLAQANQLPQNLLRLFQ
jgi:flagellin